MSLKLYKLTDQQGYTRRGQEGETKWGKGFTLTKKPCDHPELCGPDVIHAYTNPNLAFLLNPNHAGLKNPQLWEAEGEVVVKDWGKVGCFSLKTVKKLDTPDWIKDYPQRVQVWFAVLCAEAALQYFEDRYPADDRPREAIKAAKEYLTTKTVSAARAARAAADAAYAAADAAYAAHAAHAARAAAYAAHAAAYAAHAAADAADAAYAAYAADAAYAAYAAREVDFGALADKAVELTEVASCH
jgi:hypothetical protein